MTLSVFSAGNDAETTFPPTVTDVLRALEPGGALRETFTTGARGRGGGGSASQLRVVDEVEAARLPGAPVPTLPALRVPGAVERISAHLVMPGGDTTASPGNAGPVLESLRITYRPSGPGWEEAPMWPIVQEGGSVVLVMAQDADPRRRKTWPQRFPGRGDTGGGDYAVVVLAGRELGVQVDVSGVVHLAWLSLFRGRVFRMALVTRRCSQSALKLIAAGGLLT